MAEGKAKAGWGFGSKGESVQIDLTQKVERKEANIWDKKGEDIVEIPDVEEDSGAGHNKAILSPLVTNVIKVQDLAAITKSVRQVTLPIPDDGIDLSLLMSVLRPQEDCHERDEPWEFVNLKTEIYEIVSNLYGSNDYINDDL